MTKSFHPSVIKRFMTAAISFAAALFLLSAPAAACSWDYTIWQIRSKTADPLYRFIKGDKAGYIDRTGKIVIKPTLDYYGNNGEEFFDGLLLTGASAGPYIDLTGKVVLDTKYDRNWDFSEGLAVAMEKGSNKWGYIDKTGKFVISPRFETYPNGYVYSFSEGLAMIKVKDRYGYIDRTGEFVIEPKFLKGTHFNEGYAWVITEGPCVRFDFEQPCDDPERLGGNNEGQKASACKFALLNKTGEIVTSQRFDGAKDFSEGLAAVRSGEKWGFVDRRGEFVINPQFDRVEQFSDGLAAIKQNEKWGFINKQGEIVIKPQFDLVEHFSDGLAPVATWNEKITEYTDYYYIDKNGRQAFPGKFDVASYYFKGVAHVKLIDPKRKKDDSSIKGRYAYLDTTGRKIFTYKRDDEEE